MRLGYFIFPMAGALMVPAKLAALASAQRTSMEESMKQFQNMRNRFANEGTDQICLPVLDNICGLNIAWMMLVILFIWFSTMGGIAALFSPKPAPTGKKDKTDKKSTKKEETSKDAAETASENEEEKEDDTREDKEDKAPQTKKEEALNSSGGNMYLSMLSVVCIAMVVLGGYQIMNPADPYAGMDTGMPGKFAQQRVYAEDDGTDGLVDHKTEEQKPPPAASQGSCGGTHPLGGAEAEKESDCGDGAAASKPQSGSVGGAKLSGSRRLEYTFELHGYGDVQAMKQYGDANKVVGSVRVSSSGGIEGRVQAAGDDLQGMRDWMVSKGSLLSWEEALKHPLKTFEIKTGFGH